MNKPIRFTLLVQYFVQGLLVLAPVTITGYLIFLLFTNIDSLLLPIFRVLSPNPERPFYIPGLGFIIIISFVLIVGYLSSFFLIGRFLSFFDHLLERIPGVKTIYH